MTRDTLKNFTELRDFALHARSIQMLVLPFCVREQVVVLGEVSLGAPDPIHLGMADISDTNLVTALSLRWARPVIPVQLTTYELQRALDVGFGDGVAGTGQGGHPLRVDLGEASPTDDAPAQLDCMGKTLTPPCSAASPKSSVVPSNPAPLGDLDRPRPSIALTRSRTEAAGSLPEALGHKVLVDRQVSRPDVER